MLKPDRGIPGSFAGHFSEGGTSSTSLSRLVGPITLPQVPSADIHTPDKSGLPFASRGVGPDRSTSPLAVRGAPGLGYWNHWAPAAAEAPATTAASMSILSIVKPSRRHPHG